MSSLPLSLSFPFSKKDNGFECFVAAGSSPMLITVHDAVTKRPGRHTLNPEGCALCQLSEGLSYPVGVVQGPGSRGRADAHPPNPPPTPFIPSGPQAMGRLPPTA